MRDEALVELISQEWRRLPAAYRPEMVWIRRYATFRPDQTGFAWSIRPLRVWFGDERVLRERPLDEWLRFAAVHGSRPWCQLGFGVEPDGLFGDPHRIGQAAFAFDKTGGAVYVETLWGRRYGAGRRWRVDAAGAVSDEDLLWRS